MNHFEYVNDRLHVEDVPVKDIVEQTGTPVYIYSRATLARHFHAFDNAFHGLDHVICYSAKANSSLAVLKLLGDYGSGADVVSGGELFRALKADIPADRICFSGVGKTDVEIEQALDAGIMMFNVESMDELEAIQRVASCLDKEAPVAIRVNPDVDAETHPYISTGLKKNKFGLSIETAFDAYKSAAGMSHIEVVGIDFHIGSQLVKIDPFVETLSRLKLLVERLRNEDIHLKYFDLGGGLGIQYNDEQIPQPLEYATALGVELAQLGLTIVLEPGRGIAGNAGILVTRVLYNKKSEIKRFVIVDAAMNDLIRPTLYGSYHDIQPVVRTSAKPVKVDVVGPICESTDFLAQDRVIPKVQPGDLLAAMSSGAYGFTMASNYNSRVRPAEVMVDKDKFAVIKQRETHEDLIRNESIPDFLARE